MRIIKKLRYKIYNKLNGTSIGSCRASLKAKYGKNVMIGEETVITDDVTIGDYSYVNRLSSIENATIGKYCSISSGVWICPYEHNLICRTTHPFAKNKLEIKRRNVQIGNDVLVSLNVVILEGVTIGDGAVIAAGAVVTKDVKPYEVVGGVPARHIKWRFEQDEIQHLTSIQWWNYSYEDVMKNTDFFNRKKEVFELF